MLKKLSISFLLLATILVNIISPAVAQAAAPQPATWYNQGLQEWYLKVYDEKVSPPQEIFGERYTAAQVDWIIWSFLTWLPTKILKPSGTACLIGVIASQSIDFKNCWQTFFGYVNQAPYLASVPLNSEANHTTLAQAVFKERSFSGISYVKNLSKKMTIAPAVNAQGFGYTTALDPFREMWTASRDIAYSLFVFAAIILAFMVMFRVKLSPQTAVTVQSAIPKLIFGLILVTFSYAIAGFMVDMMYVVIGLLSIIGARFAPGSNLTEPIFVYNFLTVGPVIPNNIPVVGGQALGLFGLFIVYLANFALTFVISFLSLIGHWQVALVAVFTFIGTIAAFAVGLGSILLIIFFVIFLILIAAVLIMIFKTWWTIIKAFASIILLTIFAPFQLLLGTFIPSFGFGAWVKNYISNLGVFVTVGFLFYLATVFSVEALAMALKVAGQNMAIVDKIYQVLFGTTLGNTPLGNPTPGWPPLIISSSDPEYLSILYLIFSFVLFFQIPKAADIIKSFLSGKPWAYGSAIGEGLGLFGAAYGSTPVRAVGKEASEGMAGGALGWASRNIRQGGWGQRGRETAKNIAEVVGRYPKIPQVR